MQAVITGASGLVGGNLAIELIRQGHAVRGTRRSEASTKHLEAHAIAWVPADLDDVAALTHAFEGADVVFHCAALVSILARPTPALRAANVEGTRHVLEAIRAARVRRLVHCSTIGTIGLSEDGAPCTEKMRWNFAEHGLADGYVTTKREAEALVQAAIREGTDAVIVNPTYMLGPYDVKPSSGRVVVGLIKGEVPGYVGGRNNFVDVRDVARGMILASEKGRTGERYLLGGENLSMQEFFALVTKEAGIPPLRWGMPRSIAAALGLVGDVQHWITGNEPLINSNSVRWAYETRFRYSSAKAESELGYRHGPLPSAIADAIAWFRAHGLLPA